MSAVSRWPSAARWCGRGMSSGPFHWQMSGHLAPLLPRVGLQLKVVGRHPATQKQESQLRYKSASDSSRRIDLLSVLGCPLTLAGVENIPHLSTPSDCAFWSTNPVDVSGRAPLTSLGPFCSLRPTQRKNNEHSEEHEHTLTPAHGDLCSVLKMLDNLRSRRRSV